MYRGDPGIILLKRAGKFDRVRFFVGVGADSFTPKPLRAEFR
jgi:hypothetical protein